MNEYSGDHRVCQNPDCNFGKIKATQDISYNKHCLGCGGDLTNAPKANL